MYLGSHIVATKHLVKYKREASRVTSSAFLLELREEILDARPNLLSRRHNVTSRDRKAARARVPARPQLKSPRKLSLGNILGPVVAASCGLVDGGAGRAVVEAEAVDALDGTGNTGGKVHLLVHVVGSGGTAVSIRQKDKLAEGVPVNIELDARVLGKGPHVVDQDSIFGRVACCLSTVCLVTGAGGRAAGDIPLVGPVAVDVGADAGLATASLAVLAPETVVAGGVDETWTSQSCSWGRNSRWLTIGVDDGEHIDVVVVECLADSGIILLVSIDDLVGQVFNRLKGQPQYHS